MRGLVAVMVLSAACGVVPASRTQALSGAHVLWIDLDSATIASGATDDATSNVSSLGHAVVPSFDATVGAPSIDPAISRAVLVDRARGYFLPWDVEVTTTRPAMGDYAAVFVGGTSAILSPAQPAHIAGVGPVDCGDADPRSVGFAFSDDATPTTGGLVALGATIAHEAGHGFGLEHVDDPNDPMYSVPSSQQTIDDLFSLAFGTGDYSSFLAGVGTAQPEQCGRANPLDDAAILDAVLGPRTTPLGAAPTIELESPPEHATLPPIVPVQVAATGAARVEIYRDLELVATLDAAPYATTLHLPEAATTVLTVEAVGADGQRARASRTFAVSATVPPACNDALPCVAPATCVESFCAVASADASVVPDASSTAHTASGCAMGGRPTSACPRAAAPLRALKNRRSSAARG